MGKCYGQSLAA